MIRLSIVWAALLLGFASGATAIEPITNPKSEPKIRTVVGSDIYHFGRGAMRGLSRPGHGIQPDQETVLDRGEQIQFEPSFFTDSAHFSCAEAYYVGLANNGGRIAEFSYTYDDIVSAAGILPDEGNYKIVQNAPHTNPALEKKYIYNPSLGRHILLKEVIVVNVRSQPFASTEGAVDVRSWFTVGRSSTVTLSIATTQACVKNGVWPIIDSVVRYLFESKD